MDGVEVYSQQRHLISTGQVVINKGIEHRQELLDQLVGEIRQRQAAIRGDKELLVEVEETEMDSEIVDRAMAASNADKFNALCACTSSEGEGVAKVQGSYVALGFPSQSEADLALMSMFTFYSKSNEQCRRLFRMTGLGKRAKAQKDDRYLNETLRVIRARQKREKLMEDAGALAAAELIAKIQGSPGINTLHVSGNGPSVQAPAPASVSVALAGPVPAPVSEAGDNGLPWPPGFAGAIAGFIYQSAPRPVKEVAIIAALGFLAGVCGKTFIIPQSGLNMYLLLVARSAVGKEAMHSGISALIKSAAGRQPAAYNFVNFDDFASGPALTKGVAANPSFVNVAGEWGRKLKKLADDTGRDTAMASLRTTMTNLYQKSGPAAIVGGIAYSHKDNNVASVSGVAYSMIGETTPGTFYESLTESMMEDGFLSRFTIIEYDGGRAPLNEHQVLEPSKALGDAVADLCTHSLMLLSRNDNTMVGRSAEAAEIMKAFEKECDSQINSTTDESWRQMWNRASLKVMRVAALLSVADNWLHPVIQVNHVEWALTLIRRDIKIMQKKIDSGDIGVSDHSRERKVLSLLEMYLKEASPDGYGVPEKLRTAGIVPRRFLQMRTARLTAFHNHRLGSTMALDMVIRSLIDSGYISEVPKEKLIEDYKFHGKCYRIINLPE